MVEFGFVPTPALFRNFGRGSLSVDSEPRRRVGFVVINSSCSAQNVDTHAICRKAFSGVTSAMSPATTLVVESAARCLHVLRLTLFRLFMIICLAAVSRCGRVVPRTFPNLLVPPALAEVISPEQKIMLYDAYTAPKLITPRKNGGEQATARSGTSSGNEIQSWRYSEFIAAAESGKLTRTLFSADMQRVLALTKDNQRFKLDALPDDKDMINTLRRNKVDISIMPTKEDKGPSEFVRSVLVPGFIFGFLFFLTRRLQAGSFGPMSSVFDIQKSGARFSMVPHTGVMFKDVAGMDNAKIELEELVQFLKESERFTELGATIPRGVIVEGPPGTGKTLLARAVAGEAGVPFYSISGSEFVEMFVGVGASRVRDLFTQAKRNAPCIIFIDEIDAVGRQRGTGFAGGNDEREQTLNQLLTEMDGFEGNMGIIVMAATNRADVLDTALLRPGRFDRRVTVGLPDFRGRMEILKVHAQGKPLSDDVNIESVSRRTPGFSGAALQNLLNEAAICAARNAKTTISQSDIDSALERIMLGAEKRHTSMTEERRRLVAYHEAGHALVGAVVPDYDAVHKISIVPRGGAGGLTYFAPDENRVESSLYSRQFLEGQLAVALGGRVAEEIVFGAGEVTTGAADDLQQVSRVARQMVTRFGFSGRVGQIVVESEGSSSNFMRRRAMGANGGGGYEPSMELRKTVDEDVSNLVQGAYQAAKEVLTKNRVLLDEVASLLLKQDTVSAEELQILIAKQPEVFMIPYRSQPI